MLDLNMLVSGVFGLVGVFLGWGLNQLSRYFDNKPKLAFIITYNKEDLELVELRNKTSCSEYIIEIVNIGKVPVILEKIILYYEGQLLVDCFLDDDQRKILPNRSKCYQMTKQDRDALQWHCDKKLFSKCDVTAYCFNGQQINSKLDVYNFYGKAMVKNGFIGKKKAI